MMTKFIQIEKQNTDYTVLSISGRIMDKEQTDLILAEFENTIKSGAKKIILNLNKMDYINSNGLNCFISMLTKARNHGGDLIIASVPDKIQKLLLISKLNTVFTITNTVEEASALLLN